MRDSSRISSIVDLICQLWKLNPDMRLGQILYNFAGFSDCDYNLEDSLVEKLLNEGLEYYKDNENIKGN